MYDSISTGIYLQLDVQKFVLTDQKIIGDVCTSSCKTWKFVYKRLREVMTMTVRPGELPLIAEVKLSRNMSQFQYIVLASPTSKSWVEIDKIPLLLY